CGAGAMKVSVSQRQLEDATDRSRPAIRRAVRALSERGGWLRRLRDRRQLKRLARTRDLPDTSLAPLYKVRRPTLTRAQRQHVSEIESSCAASNGAEAAQDKETTGRARIVHGESTRESFIKKTPHAQAGMLNASVTRDIPQDSPRTRPSRYSGNDLLHADQPL